MLPSRYLAEPGPTPPAGLQPSLVPPSQTQNEWEVAEQRWREGLTRCREEAEAHLREVQERVDRLPQQVGVGRAVSLRQMAGPWAVGTFCLL